MGADRKDDGTSTLLVDESFASASDAFVDLVRSVWSPKYLAALADRWKQDPRPWAREQIFAYLALPFDRPGHQPVVKRLFKHAEAQQDDELMAAFLVAFDRMVRRERRMTYSYDFNSRQVTQEEQLRLPRNQLRPAHPARTGINPFTGEKVTFPATSGGVPKNGRLYSYATRNYLRRRAWRYFRRMGYMRPVDYTRAIARALAIYRDADVAKGENILDSWGLLHAAFWRSPVIEFKKTSISLASGHSLGGLVAAPRFEPLWQTNSARQDLFRLVTTANSRLVRVWAMQLLKQHHTGTFQSLTADDLLALLDHADEEVQQFGASLLSENASIDSWPIEVWLQLLNTRNVSALATICDTMAQRVRPDRLTIAQCIDLACARATPVAKMGLAWLRERSSNNVPDRSAYLRLARAECEAIGEEVAAFGLGVVASADVYRTDSASEFFDSLNPAVRRGAFDWLTPVSPGYQDPALWSRLTETPYDDIQLRLVAALNERVKNSARFAAASHTEMHPVWTAVLLNVHRGSRAKRHALRQISEAIADHPDSAEALLPVFAVAIRSVRPAEARAGLSALLAAVARRPELESALAEHVPELRLQVAGASA
jgi:hypothetical protein